MHGSLLVSLEHGSTMTTPLFDSIDGQVQGGHPLNILVIIALKVDPKPLGIHSMADATPPVLLWGVFQVHLKLSNRAVTLIEQSCMTSYHIAIC